MRRLARTPIPSQAHEGIPNQKSKIASQKSRSTFSFPANTNSL
jgi:hypothetical protein